MSYEVILLGVLVSLLFSEITGLYAGLIVPGYLVLCLQSPLRIAYTLFIALVATGICKLLSRVWILYGRRRFVLLLLLTYLLNLGINELGILPGGLSVIGVLVPGIIGREIDRQGIVDSMLAFGITTGLLAVILLLFGYPILG